jgi:rhodanese-related sulfurtransferase
MNFTQLTEFVGNHSLLVAAFIGVLFLIVLTELNRKRMTLRDVSPLQLTQLVNRQDGVVIDVREPADFNKGHIVNARNIPIAELPKRLEELEKFKDKPLIVCCQRGVTSQAGVNALVRAGFDQVFNLKGGINGWVADKLPLSKK